MNLKELKGMIAEEYGRYLKEQEDVAVDVNPDVDVDAMGDDMGEDPEATLKTIFDMLKDYFEGDEKADEMNPETDVEPAAPNSELEEFYPTKKATTTSSGKYGAAGYKNFSKTSGGQGFGDSKSLQEVKRMQKLANLIK